MPDHSTRVGVDIGGTFTDVAAIDADGRLHVGKHLTTHDAEHEGVLAAVAATAVDLSDPAAIVAHGTTLVINALLERRGVRAALVTTAGFEDVLDIGRANRTELFNLSFRREAPIVPRELRFGVAERTSARGERVLVPSEEELAELVARLRAAQVEAVAVGFLHSYVEPANEQLVAEHLRRELPQITVSTSADTSRQWREFERFTTAAANAYVAPVADRYMRRIVGGLEADGFEGQFVVLDSSGGAMTVETATRLPVRAVESGPVAGVIGARALAGRLGFGNVVTFDMGGTTAKSAMIEDGSYATADLYWIGGYERGFPLQVSSVDVLEIGVGGGSIAWVDDAGRLRVGPRSASSTPGPACYGLGGQDVTVTDANLYCGRLDKDHFVGSLQLDEQAATVAVERLARRLEMQPMRLALGILQLANLRMASVVRRQTVARGRDPREFTMLAMGGAGPMHACEVAVEANVGSVLIPMFPGHFSALGMLETNLRVDRRESVVASLDRLDRAQLVARLAQIESELRDELGTAQASTQTIRATTSLAVRYRGQEHALLVSLADRDGAVPPDVASVVRKRFEDEYARRYGHLNTDTELEVVELEVIVERLLPRVQGVAGPGGDEAASGRHSAHFANADGPVLAEVVPRSRLAEGDRLAGPAIVYEEGSTSVIPPGATLRVLAGGALLVDVTGMRRAQERAHARDAPLDATQ